MPSSVPPAGVCVCRLSLMCVLFYVISLVISNSLDVLLFLFGTSCSMSISNCSFLTCVQVSQEAGQVVWYSHLFQNFPQFIVIIVLVKTWLAILIVSLFVIAKI